MGRFFSWNYWKRSRRDWARQGGTIEGLGLSRQLWLVWTVPRMADPLESVA